MEKSLSYALKFQTVCSFTHGIFLSQQQSSLDCHWCILNYFWGKFPSKIVLRLPHAFHGSYKNFQHKFQLRWPCNERTNLLFISPTPVLCKERKIVFKKYYITLVSNINANMTDPGDYLQKFPYTSILGLKTHCFSFSLQLLACIGWLTYFTAFQHFGITEFVTATWLLNSLYFGSHFLL